MTRPNSEDRVLDKDGNVDMAAVAVHDLVAKKLAQEGLLMQVISLEIMEMEPTGVSIVSQSLSKRVDFALLTSVVAALREVCSAVDKEVEAAVADQIIFQDIRIKATQQIDRIVQDLDFVELFGFIVGLGSTRAAFIPVLLEFGQAFVNSKRRGLRLSAFRIANKLSDQVPWVKVALIMRCYWKGVPTRSGAGVEAISWCPHPEAFWAKRTSRD